MSTSGQKSISSILWMSFLAMAFQMWFAFLEGTMVMVAIHNQHYSLYFFGFAVLGLFFAWKAFRWRKANPNMKGFALFVHISFTIIMMVAFFIGLLFLSLIALMLETWS